MKRFPALFATLAVIALSASSTAATPSATSLLERARQKLASINDYSVDMRLDVKGDNLTIKGMAMTLYYKKPNKTRLVAKQGFAAMPRNMTLGNAVEELTKNSRASVIRTEKKSGLECYVIRLDPVQGSGQPTTTLWLDKSRMLVRATKTGGPFPVKTEWQYARVDEKYDLPLRIEAEVTSPMGPSFKHHGPDGPHAGKQTPPAGGGTQTIHATLSFMNYRVNKGIRDSVFTSEKPPGN